MILMEYLTVGGNMADSDSDLEVIGVVPVSQRQRTSSNRLPRVLEDDEDELLDLDDDYIVSTRRRSSSRSRVGGSKSNARTELKKSATTTANKKSSSSSETKKKVQEIVLSDDEEEDKGSDATEVVRSDDDDLSLPSLSPPSSPPPRPALHVRRSNGTAYNSSNDNDVMEMEFDDDDDAGFKDSYPLYQSSSSRTTTATTTVASKGSSKSSLDDVDFDELLQEAEYESLGDYLAKIDKKKSNRKSSETSKPAASKSGSSSSSSATTNSKAVPSLTSFARQQSASAKAIPKSAENSLKAKLSADKADKPPTSYQVNRKSPGRKGKTKKKDKEIVTVASSSSSATSVPPQAPSTAVQGPPGRQKPPKDVLKMIILQIPENILSDEIAAKLIEKEVQFKIVTSPVVADSILFEHNIPYKMVEKDFQVHEKMLKEIDANVLIIFHVEQHLELLQGELDRFDQSSSSEQSESLTEWIQEIQKRNPEKKITLLIQGLEAYLRKIQRSVQKEYRDRVLNGENPDNGKKKRKGKTQQSIKLSRYEVQNALISTQLETHMNYRFYENSSDLALLLLQYAKSVGEAPAKQEKMKSTDFDWYAVADAVGGIPVEENGQGMRSLWLAQLQQFPKVGQESALAIARQYGSPKELYKAYRRCSTVEEGKNLLANIQVTMGVGPLAKSRRLGPEASKKIYRFFTSTDGEREIDG